MGGLRKIEVSTGIYWVEAPSVDVRVLCGCPADAVKHLMKRGLIAPTERHAVTYETGPNVILLSDAMVQNGAFSNLAEFPVLQMLYRQGMILPNHPGNTGAKPLLIGSAAQVRAQLQYIYRGNYGLVSAEELVTAGVPAAEADEMMRIKLKFAFGAIRHPGELIDTIEIEGSPVVIKGGLTVRRLRLNVFEFALDDDRVVVDLNLPPYETYECPYPLGFYYIPREYFAVVHSGEGDGWDINRPSMSSILMFQGRIYLIDVGPNILATLTALGIGVNEIEGIFHTHSHDDHFAGLTTLIRSDHRIKYYATPMVEAAVAKKMAALLSIQEEVFSEYFDVHHLVQDKWNDIEGLEVRPAYSPHPVETTIFFFRALWEGGFRTYAHFADICRIQVLKSFLTDDATQPGLSQRRLDRTLADYAIPADIKKVDVGGGMIHGDAFDFREDRSGKIILAHTAQKHTVAQRAIGSAASFGTVDILIPTDHDFIWRTAQELLSAAFPDVAQHQLRVLMNNPMVMFNPGTIVLKERHTTKDVWIVLSGTVEALAPEGGIRSLLSAGAIVGELSGLFGALAGETYRALGFVKALKVSCSLYIEFVRRNALLGDISRLLEHRDFLQRTWLFGEVVSTKTLNSIAREMQSRPLPERQAVDISPDSIGVVQRGRIGRFIGERMIGTIGPGDFFGEEMSIFWTPSMFQLRTLEPTDIKIIPANAVAGIPSIRWRLFEAWGKRMNVFDDAGSGRSSLRWQEEHRVDVLSIDKHHRRMFELAGAAVDAAYGGADRTNVIAALDALVEYTHYHFGDEEALLERAGYPDAEPHRLGHARMAADLAAFRDTITHGGTATGNELEVFLRDWLEGHVADGDCALGQFLNAKGIY